MWPLQVSAGIDLADVHEPGTAWKPEHHRDPDVARSKLLEPLARSAPLEAEDVEAAHEDAPGAAEAMRLAAEQLWRVGAPACRRLIGEQPPLAQLPRCSRHSSAVIAQDVVLPHAIDLEHAHGDTFDAQVELLHHPPAVGVARDDVDLPVQPQPLEGELEDDDDSLGDEAWPA